MSDDYREQWHRQTYFPVRSSREELMERFLFVLDGPLFASTNLVLAGSGWGDSWREIEFTLLFLYNILWLDSTNLIPVWCHRWTTVCKLVCAFALVSWMSSMRSKQCNAVTFLEHSMVKEQNRKRKLFLLLCRFHVISEVNSFSSFTSDISWNLQNDSKCFLLRFYFLTIECSRKVTALHCFDLQDLI